MSETIAQLANSVSQHKTSTEAAIEHKAYDESLAESTHATLKDQLNAIKGQEDEFPELSEPHLLISSPAGVQIATEQSTHLASSQHTAITTGGELSFSVINRFVASVGKGIRLFAQSKGIWLKSAVDPIRLEAQSDNIELYAEQNIDAKGKKTVKIVAGDELIISCQGNYIKMGSDGMEIGSPTQIFHYSPMNVLGNKSYADSLNEMPKSKFDQQVYIMQPNGKPAKNVRFEIVREDGSVIKGVTDSTGNTKVQKAKSWGKYTINVLGKAK
jgi:type VI secretion system secreted protein VgrG